MSEDENQPATIDDLENVLRYFEVTLLLGNTI
jgi:hypothetical protein